VGRLAPHKRWDLLLRTVAEIRAAVPDLRLDLIGDGVCRAALEGLTAELGIGDIVTFHGRVGQETRDRTLASAWLTACVSEVEGWGLAVTEAMSLGVPAIVLAVPGLRDSVQHGRNGWVVPGPGQLARELVEAIGQLRDPACASAWAARCRDWCDRFTWSATADRIASILIAEDIRQSCGDDRHISDLATVVDLPLTVAAAVDFTRLRSLDQVDWPADQRSPDPRPVRLLLAGQDEVDARYTLDRLGVATHELSIRVALPSDLLGWRRSAGPRAGDLQAMFAERAGRTEPALQPVTISAQRTGRHRAGGASAMSGINSGLAGTERTELRR
jgi:hypothetical protein